MFKRCLSKGMERRAANHRSRKLRFCGVGVEKSPQEGVKFLRLLQETSDSIHTFRYPCMTKTPKGVEIAVQTPRSGGGGGLGRWEWYENAERRSYASFSLVGNGVPGLMEVHSPTPAGVVLAGVEVESSSLTRYRDVHGQCVVRTRDYMEVEYWPPTHLTLPREEETFLRVISRVGVNRCKTPPEITQASAWATASCEYRPRCRKRRRGHCAASVKWGPLLDAECTTGAKGHSVRQKNFVRREEVGGCCGAAVDTDCTGTAGMSRIWSLIREWTADKIAQTSNGRIQYMHASARDVRKDFIRKMVMVARVLKLSTLRAKYEPVIEARILRFR
ncbi:hypothetical protein DFH08DRAFT_811510 [Mycena albidolilacea]|uniref:Uncharacterized protein n=1 Tax=Mycena albidolilacea TaxID=1033008 RepID=A0AAD6ZVG1_9AGAR|nr:hypothetical protein DFH08DRAFT_811510 [Mycena albidolilacea]